MLRKYTEPCPHCGQEMKREPTLQERAEDVINGAIYASLGECWHSANDWPGTRSVTRAIMNALADGRIGLAEVKGEGDRNADA